jgi:cellulose synthase/poly-beta-1,6-N-acetylglucosamine synthase-like glycosyltransferase
LIKNWGCSNPLGSKPQLFGINKIQAFALDAHFTLEQVGRNSKLHFINFNGTAGVWRKQCILDAGNWESDTLTEDLDLSYRAQLKEFKYLENVVTC